MIGFKSDVIKNYFKSGKNFGLKIKYSYLPEKADTAERLYAAKKFLKKYFLLLYSDNYSSLNINKLFSKFIISKKIFYLYYQKKRMEIVKLIHLIMSNILLIEIKNITMLK